MSFWFCFTWKMAQTCGHSPKIVSVLIPAILVPILSGLWRPHRTLLISVTKIKCDWNSDAIGRIVLSMLEIFKENPIMHKTFGAPADTQKVLFHENLRPGSLTLWIGNGNHSTFTEMEVLQMLPLRFLINIVQLA